MERRAPQLVNMSSEDGSLDIITLSTNNHPVPNLDLEYPACMYPGKSKSQAVEMEKCVALARQLQVSGLLEDEPILQGSSSMTNTPGPFNPAPRGFQPTANSNATRGGGEGGGNSVGSSWDEVNYGRSRNLSLPNAGNFFNSNPGQGPQVEAPWMNGSSTPNQRNMSVSSSGRNRDQRHRNPYGPDGMAAGEPAPTNPYANAAQHSPPAQMGNGNRVNHNQNTTNRTYRNQRLGNWSGAASSRNGFSSNRHNSPLLFPPRVNDFFAERQNNSPGPSFFGRRHQDLAIIRSFGVYGAQDGQFNMPQGLCLGIDDQIIVADTLNHRVQIFDKKGNFVIEWGIPGVKRGQLWHPRKVAFMAKFNRLVVSDRVNGCSRIQIFGLDGQYIATVSNLHSLRMALNTTTAGLTIYQRQIVVVEVCPPACVVLDEVGHMSYFFSLEGVMTEPSDIVVANGKFLISDFRGHSICVFNTWGQLLKRIGENYPGIISYPRGLGLTPSGLLLVADTDQNRFHVSKWNPETGELVAYHGLQNVKVSHSCGIIMNSAGELMTAVKKEHMILVVKVHEATCDLKRRGWNVNAPSFQCRKFEAGDASCAAEAIEYGMGALTMKEANWD